MPKVIERLEQMLTLWEHECFLHYVMMIAGSAKERKIFGITSKEANTYVKGPEKHWRKFRQYVLSYRGGQFDEKRFVDMETWNAAGRSMIAVIPGLFASWMAFSRHVYNIAPDLQLLLELTSVSNLRWDDLPWPFDAFAIRFGRPIQAAEGVNFDMMLVNRRSLITYIRDDPTKKPSIEFMLLPTNLGDFIRLDWRKMQRLEHLMNKGHNAKALNEIALYQLDQEGNTPQLTFGFVSQSPDERIKDSLDRYDGRHARPGNIQASDVAMRVMIGLCIHLASLPPKHTAIQMEGPAPPPDPEIRAITSGAHVCTVLSGFTLSPDERHALGTIEAPRQYHQLSPHWRRGHFRREKGQGQNLNAPRCIWVRPTLVRRDLLKHGMQVGGAQVDVE